MAWASLVSATQNTSITTEQIVLFGGSLHIGLNPGESAHCQVDVNFPSTPTDHAIVAVYASPDGGTTYDLTPLLQFQLDKATDPNRASFLISGVHTFRIGVRRSGSTDTLTSADCRYRLNGISV